jgi:hypothetical protein
LNREIQDILDYKEYADMTQVCLQSWTRSAGTLLEDIF